jgi:hypothetical protein
MKRKDIKLGDVLAWNYHFTLDEDSSDRTAVPVRIVDLDREVPTMSRFRAGVKAVQTGTRSAVFGVRLRDDLMTPEGDEFEVMPRNASGLWYDRTERVAARNKRGREAEARAQARADAWVATHERVGELSSPGLRRGMLDTRGRSAGRVSIDVDDLLNLIKAARAAALNEFEGTGGRHD